MTEVSPIIGTRLLSIKQYEVWQGNNHIYCSGRIITGPERFLFWFTVFLIVGPFSVFLLFVATPMWSESPLYVVTGVVMLMFVLATLFSCSFCDPGILPRVLNPIDTPLEPKETKMRGCTLQLSYCITCHIWKPPRAHHCSICNNCVASFDHHCPWVGNCIGERNYRIFFTFLWEVSLSTVYVGLVSIQSMNLFQKGALDYLQLVKDNPYATALLFYSFIVFLLVGGLGVYHCYLVGNGASTYEMIKKVEIRPWNRGCFLNFVYTLCAPRETSLIDLRGPVRISSQ